MSEQPKEKPPGDGYKRTSGGKFGPGNKGGKGGSREAAKARSFRKVLLEAITNEGIEAAVAALVKEASQGNVQAIRELFDRAVGRPESIDLLERLEAAEEALAKMQTTGSEGA